MNFKKYKNLGHKRMLDIKYIAENPDVIKDGLAKKGYSKDVIDVDALIALYKDINKLKTSSQSLSEEKKQTQQFHQIRIGRRTSCDYSQKQGFGRRA